MMGLVIFTHTCYSQVMSIEKESVKLSDLIKEIPKPKRRNLIQEHFFKGKSEEEIKEWRAKAAQTRRDTWTKKRAEKAEMIEQAKALVPSMLAYDMLSEEVKKDNWVPTQELIDKVKLLLKKDMPMETLRAKYFATVSDKTWHHLMKFVFKSQINASEDLGAELMRVKLTTVNRLKKQGRDINKQIKHYKEEKNTKIIPAYLMQMKRDVEMDLIKIEQDVASTLFKVGAVGEKSKSPSFTINMKLPRPEKVEKEVIET